MISDVLPTQRPRGLVARTVRAHTMHIPRIVHVVWVGDKPYPYTDNLRTWADHNPNWDVWLWTDNNLPSIRLHNQDVYDALMHLHPAVRADLLRLELLYRYGGLYSDADSWCMRPLRPLLEGRTLVGMTGSRGNVANGTLGATKGHPAMRALVEGAAFRYRTMKNSPKNQEGHSIFGVFGTRYVTPLLRSFPDFTQIDEGREQGTRRLIARADEANENTFIAHGNAVSWKKETGTDRVVL
ncbi:hypothetical protein FZ103_00355 [Streptomonospora sp. PA3]|uniref:glycosyltransferase family 32 protein n=1 Tax=Streptomonospora sp. PA3 TaxID=2607326 RepID=UPI0012DF8E2A|nr:glycosyltransferase [Streptomonospora sp. PA3]MUL39645.1 hypothetical protein [Streptomonospora sp. PA3]